MTNALRQLPSVDWLLQSTAIQLLIDEHGRAPTLAAVRDALAEARTAIAEGSDAPAHDALVEAIQARFQLQRLAHLQPVINATGVIIHTNLGRAPLSQAALAAMKAAARGYSNLEFDLVLGSRGGRGHGVERLLTSLTGAQAALAVNNNASAVLLALTALLGDKGVVISRGQLVEIGGGFRVPDVMRQSGARLIEVGTTNRTHLSDYADALDTDDDVGAFLRAHRSNFRLVGFVTEPSLEEMAVLAHRHDLIVIDDLGSGALLDSAEFGLEHEPMVQESIQAGADIVCFSGDKLLGGPQGGLIIGRSDLVARIRRHPWARAVRIDKVALAALQATLIHYEKGEALQHVPVWQMIGRTSLDLKRQARRWMRSLRAGGFKASIVDGRSAIGGGSLPGATLPSSWVAVHVPSPDEFAKQLRQGTPPIVARIEDDQLILDPRTVLREQENALLAALVDTVQ